MKSAGDPALFIHPRRLGTTTLPRSDKTPRVDPPTDDISYPQLQRKYRATNPHRSIRHEPTERPIIPFRVIHLSEIFTPKASADKPASCLNFLTIYSLRAEKRQRSCKSFLQIRGQGDAPWYLQMISYLCFTILYKGP
jgi:hypothetical protein